MTKNRRMITSNATLAKRLHPRLTNWFRQTFGEFTNAQLRCVPTVLDRKSVLLTSPTGSGKTLAGFLGVFDFLLRKMDRKEPLEGVQCIYVSPLRALAYDIEKNLRAPIKGMRPLNFRNRRKRSPRYPTVSRSLPI